MSLWDSYVKMVNSKKPSRKEQEYIDRTNGNFAENGFKVSHAFTNSFPQIYIDNTNKKWAVVLDMSSIPHYYDYKDILQFELFEDGNSVIKGRAGSAVVGDLTFGTIGGIVGGSMSRKMNSFVTSIQVIITVNDMDFPKIVINILANGRAQRGSFIYKKLIDYAKLITSTLANMQAQVQNSEHNDVVSSADEIKKYKELLDSGAITQEEYDTKKKQLLGT